MTPFVPSGYATVENGVSTPIDPTFLSVEVKARGLEAPLTALYGKPWVVISGLGEGQTCTGPDPTLGLWLIADGTKLQSPISPQGANCGTLLKMQTDNPIPAGGSGAWQQDANGDPKWVVTQPPTPAAAAPAAGPLPELLGGPAPDPSTLPVPYTAADKAILARLDTFLKAQGF